jgi:undecaprenyl-diphosphatase
MRLPSRHFFGWHFVIGLILFAAMTLVLVAISDQVMKGQPLTQLDAQLSKWVQVHRTPAGVMFFRYVTLLGSTFMAITLATLAGVHLLRQKQLYRFSSLVLSIVGGSILNALLKSFFQRARPQFDDPIQSFTGYSFPSGHTMTATLLYGCIALLIVAGTKSQHLRVLTIVATSILIGLVAFSRIYLGAHYLTDVVSAVAEGLAWLSLCFTFVYSFWRERSKRSTKEHG